MRILIVTNLYRPQHQGGYELRCRQVAEYLQRKGHEVRVVASDFAIRDGSHTVAAGDELVEGVTVYRFLRQHRLDPLQGDGRLYFLNVVRRQIRDITRFGQILDHFKPDVVNWWNLEGVTKAILRMASDRGIPAVHCIDDNWMIREFGARGDADLPLWTNFWRVNWGPRFARPLVRWLLAPLEHRLERRGVPTRRFPMPSAHVLFISEFWRFMHQQAGLDVDSSDVIYGGVDPERFFIPRSPVGYAHEPLRLLYAGYVDERRGLLTIVEALGLVPSAQRDRIHLSVAYGGPFVPDEYVTRVKTRIAQLGLSNHVTFLGRVSHDEMPAVYAAHDILVFASTRNEGMPMVMMEAMCAGCAVPNTGSGGAIELSERADTPLFPKDHPFALSRLITALERDRPRVAAIAARGQQTVLREFTLDHMLQRTCEALTRVAAGERPSVDISEPAVASTMLPDARA